MSTAFLAAVETHKQPAILRYFGILKDMASGDTIGVSVSGDIFLHTVPAGGQSLSEAILALCELIAVDVLYGAHYSPNSDFDQCMYVRELGPSVQTTLTLPVYVVA